MSESLTLIVPDGVPDATIRDALDSLTAAGFIVNATDGFDSTEATAYDLTPARFD